MATLKPVLSSNIFAIGYDPATHILAIRFKSKDGEPGKTIYQHKDVPQEHFDALMAADSIGGFYARHVRGKFDHDTIDA